MTSRSVSVARQNEDSIREKYFTVQEANASLPYVSRVVGDIVEAYARIVELREAVDQGQNVQRAERDYQLAMDRLTELVDELHRVGVALKDFETGLVDFPALYQDRQVSLCWQLGEGRVAHWHEVTAGFEGRQPVGQLKPDAA